MPRTGTETIRRTALVKATISEIGSKGSLEVTVSQIAKKAGVSSALAHHYFGSKEQIFLASMRYIMREFSHEVKKQLFTATGPKDRVDALLRASFTPDNFKSEVISAWLNFYVHAQKSTSVQQLLRVYQRRLQSNLVHELRPLAGEKSKEIARGLGAMIDGLYIREALRDAPPDGARSMAIALDYLDMSLREKGVA